MTTLELIQWQNEHKERNYEDEYYNTKNYEDEHYNENEKE